MREAHFFAHAKINWFLDIMGIMPDGYHRLDMLMQKISLCDELIIQESETLSLLMDNGQEAEPDNLVMRAAQKLQPLSRGQGARIILKKRIPAGAGLGGGSADAACALLALRDWWQISLPDKELFSIGLSLGADVPFCLNPFPARVQGIGEQILPVQIYEPAFLVVMKPPQSLSTPLIFRAFDKAEHSAASSDPEAGVKALKNQRYGELFRIFRNALYAPALSILPQLENCIAALYRQGASFAAMSGSGSALFGVFEQQKSAEKAALLLKDRYEDHFICVAQTLPRSDIRQETICPVM